jgi:hypothetical protein
MAVPLVAVIRERMLADLKEAFRLAEGEDGRPGGG